MPLIKSKSKEAFKKNVKAEIASNKPRNQALSIAYRVQRDAKKNKYAEGGRTFYDKLKETTIGRIVQDAASAVMAPGRAYQSTPDNPITTEQMIKPSADLAGLATMGATAAPAMRNTTGMGIRAYHGSPYDFDKFDLSKIGTGEGAQAYGHGLYFAENPGVAKSYAGMSKTHPVQPDSAHIAAAQDFVKHGMDPHEGLRKAYPNASAQEIEAAVVEAKGGFKPNLYKVDLPDDQVAKMLDWDKPLSQQPESVQKLARELGIDGSEEALYRQAVSQGMGKYSREYAKRNAYEPSGEHLYAALGRGKLASDKLRELGVPGIKYLDQGSRSGGKGTSNFVVFDDRIPKIIGRE
jgi:hypothetical protein